MRVKISDIRKIVQEEMRTLDKKEVVSERTGVARQAGPRSVARKFGGYGSDDDSRVFDPTDAPEPEAMIDARLSDASRNAAQAVSRTLKALAAFNPRWHSLVCRTSQGQEMSDLVTDLESTLKGLSSELSESAKVTPDEIREMVMEEAKKLGLNELFGGVTRVKGPRAVRGRRQQATKWEPSKAAMSDAAPKSQGVARAQKLISDWLFLHSTFSPKFRRSMCLGKAGDTLAFELQNLDDMLAKL